MRVAAEGEKERRAEPGAAGRKKEIGGDRGSGEIYRAELKSCGGVVFVGVARPSPRPGETRLRDSSEITPAQKGFPEINPPDR